MLKRQASPFTTSLLAAVLITGPSMCRAEAATATATAASRTLYSRMGGEPTAKAVVGEVIEDAAHNPTMKRSFAKVDLARVKRLLVEQI